MTVSPKTRKVAKVVTHYAVSFSVGYTTASLITQNVSPKNTLQRVELFIGASVLGSMAVDKAVDFADRKLDDIINSFESAMNDA